jgi:hypothetical protein
MLTEAQTETKAQRYTDTPFEWLAVLLLTECFALGQIARGNVSVVGADLIVEFLVVVQPHLSNAVEVPGRVKHAWECTHILLDGLHGALRKAVRVVVAEDVAHAGAGDDLNGALATMMRTIR